MIDNTSGCDSFIRSMLNRKSAHLYHSPFPFTIDCKKWSLSSPTISGGDDYLPFLRRLRLLVDCNGVFFWLVGSCHMCLKHSMDIVIDLSGLAQHLFNQRSAYFHPKCSTVLQLCCLPPGLTDRLLGVFSISPSNHDADR